jgi:hypothetical protein
MQMLMRCKHCEAGEDYNFATDSLGHAVASHGYLGPPGDEMVICTRWNRFVHTQPTAEDGVEASLSLGDETFHLDFWFSRFAQA